MAKDLRKRFHIDALCPPSPSNKPLYIAYAPEFGVSAYGGRRDEALNDLSDEIAEHQQSRGERQSSLNALGKNEA